jgi:iron uptake system component EfeO
MKRILPLVSVTILSSAIIAGCGQQGDQQTSQTTPASQVQENKTSNDSTSLQNSTSTMIQTSEQVKKALDEKKDSEIKTQVQQVNDQWIAFEEQIKPKFPDTYVKIEKYLMPLTAGAKQEPLNVGTLAKMNDQLHSTLQELASALQSGKTGVNKEALASSNNIQAATQSYIKYVNQQGELLVTELTGLDAAIKSGNLQKAQEAYVKARMPYERVEPVIEKIKELDALMDARVDDFASAEDPNFTGYHRIENFLFVKKTTKGAEKYGADLLENGKKMKESMAKAKIEPVDFVTGVGELMEEAQTKKITGEEERWSGATLPILRANAEGTKAIFDLVQGELKTKDPVLEQKISKQLQVVLKEINTLSPEGGTWKNYNTLEQSKKIDLKNKIELLAENMSKMPGTLGV